MARKEGLAGGRRRGAGGERARGGGARVACVRRGSVRVCVRSGDEASGGTTCGGVASGVGAARVCSPERSRQSSSARRSSREEGRPARTGTPSQKESSLQCLSPRCSSSAAHAHASATYLRDSSGGSAGPPSAPGEEREAGSTGRGAPLGRSVASALSWREMRHGPPRPPCRYPRVHSGLTWHWPPAASSAVPRAAVSAASKSMSSRRSGSSASCACSADCSCHSTSRRRASECACATGEGGQGWVGRVESRVSGCTAAAGRGRAGRARHRLLVLGQQRHVAQQQPRLPVVQHRELPRAALAGHRLAVGGRDGERQQRPQQRRIALHRDERVEAEGRADRARRVRVDGVARRDEERVQRPRHL